MAATDGGNYYRHLYDCSYGEGEVLNQLEMANKKLGSYYDAIPGGYYQHLYDCSYAEGETIAQMEALNKGLADFMDKKDC